MTISKIPLNSASESLSSAQGTQCLPLEKTSLGSVTASPSRRHFPFVPHLLHILEGFDPFKGSQVVATTSESSRRAVDAFSRRIVSMEFVELGAIFNGDGF